MDKEMPTAKVAAKLLINYEKQGGSDYFFINKATAEGDSKGKKGDNPPATRHNGGADDNKNKEKRKPNERAGSQHWKRNGTIKFHQRTKKSSNHELIGFFCIILHLEI